jgi:hypothetical protein
MARWTAFVNEREVIMIRAFAGSLMLVSLALVGEQVPAQTTNDVVGTYKFVSETRERDGTKTETRETRDGRLLLDANGNYLLTTISTELPRVASNNRITATPEEAKAIVSGSLTHFGTYSVVDNALVFRVERATFANWNGIEQKRPFTLTGDELKYTLPVSSGGGSVTLTWRRAK